MALLNVVAKIKAKKGHEEKVETELLKLIKPTRLEEGCIAYDLHKSLDDPGLFIFYETWSQKERLERHLTSRHMKAYLLETEGLVDQWELNLLEKIGPA